MRKIVAAAGSLLLVLGLLLSACAPAAVPTPAPPPPTPTPRPAAAQPAPTPVPTPKPALAPLWPTPVPTPKAGAIVEKPRYGGIVTTAMWADAPSPDAHQERQAYVQNAFGPAYSLLVQNDPQDATRIIGDLAERWEVSPEGKVYTFYLHKGVRFHDGRPATSADVKVSFERIAWPPKGIISPRSESLGALERIEAPDEHTVRFTLKYPQVSFLDMVASPFNWIYPKHVLAEKGDMKKVVVGTGPFRFVEYNRGVNVQLVKNPDYFVPGRPYLDGIMRYILRDRMAQFAALRTGRILLATLITAELSPAEREILRREAPQVVQKGLPTSIADYTIFNFKRKPFDDVRVRRAIDLVIDRQAAVKVAARGDGQIGGYLMPGTGWEIPEKDLIRRPGYRQPKDADIAEAKRLLAEAGYPNGFKTNVLVLNAPVHLEQAVFSKAELAKIGIDAALQPTETAAFNARVYAADFDLASHFSSFRALDPDDLLSTFYLKNSASNWGRYGNQKLEELFVKQSQTMDSEQRRKLLREIENILLEDLPRVVYFWNIRYAFWWPEVRGWTPQPGTTLNMKFEGVWLAK